MSKRTKLGIAAIVLLALLPIYIFFAHAGEDTAGSAEKPSAQASETASSEKDAKKKSTDTEKANEDRKTEETSTETVTIENNEESVPDTTEPAALDEIQSVFQDFLVVIDPGHQERANLEHEPVGPGARETKIKVSGGTTGVATGKSEYQLTLEAALILGELLENNGVKVIYTRTTHNVNISNRERAELANHNQADLFIRIHADGEENQGVSGLSVLTPASGNPYTKGIYDDSLKASQFILEEAKKNPAVKVNGIAFRGDLSGFNWSKVPSTLVEMGYMTNPAEDKKLSDTIYLTNLMTNIAEGILQYANYKR